jgi:hypothetical protein
MTIVILSLLPPRLSADHGPGTSGGGVSTQSGETLKPGKVSLDLRWDYTQFESLSRAEIENHAFDVGGDEAHFDAQRWSSLVTLSLAYGVVDGFQIGISTGWYRADDFQQAHLHEDGELETIGPLDVNGATDLWINGKYRFLKGPYGSLAAFGGIKLPTGRDDVSAEDERLEPTAQPGSGAFDFALGTAYSVFLTERIALDASAQYIFRTENDGFRIGDRFEAGVAAAYRLREDVQTYPQVNLFAEATVRHLQRNEEDGEEERNSGGTVLFLSPGIRVGFTEHLSLSVAPRFPAVQALNNPQQDTLFQVGVDLTLVF